MPEQRHHSPQDQTIDGYEPAVFGGFERPDANFVFTPNQYLDLCIPHASRGCARLVGYMLRHLIGWRDADGNPLYEKVEVTQRELERRANVGKSSINAALAEAEALGFILCVTRGRPNTLGESAVQNAWALRWDDSGHYADALDGFRGFYRGEGRRTTVPNQFFDEVLPNETHAVVKLVGAVLRHTVGYQNRITGGSVSSAPLSYSQLCHYSNCGRTTLKRTVPYAVERSFIRRVKEGRFAFREDDREAAVYAVCWAPGRNAPKMSPAVLLGPKTERPENGPSPTPRKWTQQRPENGPSERPENGPTINTEQIHSERQQQQTAAAASLFDEDEGVALLVREGFDPKTAGHLARLAPLEEIERQIAWLPHRNVTTNKAGFLRRAIEEHYGEPAELVRSTVLRDERERREREVGDQVRQAHESERRRRHEEAHRAAYLAHVLTLGPTLERSHPERYASLVERRAEHRKLLETMALRPEGRRRALARHDAGPSLAADLAETFADAVPDFWTWDRDLNANGLGS